MLPYCLNCKKNTESIDPKVSDIVMVEQWYYQNVPYVAVKNQHLLKNKKQEDY